MFSFLIGHQFLVVLLPHKARASHNTAVDDLGSIGAMCGITASNDFCELIISVIIVPWIYPHAKRFIGVVWSMDVIERMIVTIVFLLSSEILRYEKSFLRLVDGVSLRNNIVAI